MADPNARDLERLKGVDTLLASVTLQVIRRHSVECHVSEGLRTAARQRELVAAGKSKTLDSKHLTGHAVDLIVMTGGKPDWSPKAYTELARTFAQVALEFGIPIRWGGSWRWISGPNCHDYPFLAAKFFDGPHFETER